MQFKRYNSNHSHFEIIFRNFSNSFPDFFERIEEIVRESDDPKVALERDAALHSNE